MKISFDFDGTLTDARIRTLALELMKSHKVYILTSRFADCMKDVFHLGEQMGIPKQNILSTNGKDKGAFLYETGLDINVHFDDDYFDFKSITEKTKTLCVLIDASLHPNNQTEE